jgi:hypothetical protein
MPASAYARGLAINNKCALGSPCIPGPAQLDVSYPLCCRLAVVGRSTRKSIQGTTSPTYSACCTYIPYICSSCRASPRLRWGMSRPQATGGLRKGQRIAAELYSASPGQPCTVDRGSVLRHCVYCLYTTCTPGTANHPSKLSNRSPGEDRQ